MNVLCVIINSHQNAIELSTSSLEDKIKSFPQRQRRNRRTSSSADDSGCGDTAGSLSTIKSPTVQSSIHLSPDFENDHNEKDDFPKIIHVKGASPQSSKTTHEKSGNQVLKRRRTIDEEEDDGSEIEEMPRRQLMNFDPPVYTTNPEQSVSEDEAKQPKWQPKVVVSKELSDSEIKEMAKLDKSSISICSTSSNYSLSSLRTSEEKEAIKIKY